MTGWSEDRPPGEGSPTPPACAYCGEGLPPRGTTCPACGGETYGWLARAGQVWGPYDLETLRYLRRYGLLRPTDLLTWDPQGNWQPALPVMSSLAEVKKTPPEASPAYLADPTAESAPPAPGAESAVRPPPQEPPPLPQAERRGWMTLLWIGLVLLLLALGMLLYSWLAPGPPGPEQGEHLYVLDLSVLACR